MRLPPYQQGGLDSLCGVYSIVNADIVVNGHDRKRSQAHFNALVAELYRRKRLLDILVSGTAANTMHMLLRGMAKQRKAFGRVDVPWRGVATPGLDEFWRSMQDFVGEGRAIIICLRGFHDHWTVIRRISRQTIWLHDSGGIQKLVRHDCTTVNEGDARRTHVLRPAQAYFLSRDGGPVEAK